MFVEAMELLLRAEADLAVAGTVQTEEEALAHCSAEAPDVILLDIDQPGMDPSKVTRQLLEACPDGRVVIITSSQDEGVVINAIEAGARGYLRKTRSVRELVGVIKMAAAGEMVIPAEDMDYVLKTRRRAREEHSKAWILLNQLTDRERDVLRELTKGLSTADVASALSISIQTVQTYVKNILAKLDLHSKLEAVLFAIRQGFPEGPGQG
jgi:DNA-binding NarL/FixJ family response regulator